MNRDAHLRGHTMARGQGFTLIELLVAAVITLVIAGLCLNLLGIVLNRWNRSQGIQTAEREARLILDRLERDLDGALFRPDGGIWLAASVQPTSSVSLSWRTGVKPAAASLNTASDDLSAARFGVAGAWLRFITATTAPDRPASEPTAPVAVSYQIIRRGSTTSARTMHYMLYRAEVTARAAFAAGYDLGSAPYNTASDESGVPGSLVSPGFAQAIADDVIDFGVRCYRHEADPNTGGVVLQRVFPRTPGDLEYGVNSSPVAGKPPTYPPAVVDVLIRVISAEGARQLEALENGRITGDWWAIATAHSWVFTRRIALKAAPN